MRLTIDRQVCDLPSDFRFSIGFDAEALRSAPGTVAAKRVRLRLPATADNDRIFRLAGDLHPGERFNAAGHEAELSREGCLLHAGRVCLLEAANDAGGGRKEYLIELCDPAAERFAATAGERLDTLPIDFSATLTPQTIVRSWSDRGLVRFLPVHRDSYRPAPSSVALGSVERMLSTDDYHPFLAIEPLVRAIFSEAGYALRSDFMEGALFRSLYMSGAYPSRDMTAVRRHMDFCALRRSSRSAAADPLGRVYASAFKTLNSVGGFVETVDPGETDEAGEPLAEAFSNNRCFSFASGEPLFTPRSAVSVGFEYRIRYVTDYRIASRVRLTGFDSVYLGDGTELRGALANRHADRRNELRPYFRYRAVVFGHREGDAYRLTCTRNGTGGYVFGEFAARSGEVTTPAAERVAAPVLLCRRAGETDYLPYAGDWALYDGYVEECGRTEVELVVRTPPVAVTPAQPKSFSSVYFYGAEEGMRLTLDRSCSLRPDFSSAPGLGSVVGFADVTRHPVSRRTLLEAVGHLFNLRWFADEQTRTVYVEPADDFYRLGCEADWSDRIDFSQPVLLGDLAQTVGRERIYRYRAGDGAVKRLDATLPSPFGVWRATNDSAAAVPGEREVPNPLFSPSVSRAGDCADAPSALLLQTGDRDEESGDPRYVSPRIVRYCGLAPLPAGERWGFPAEGSGYPLAAFHLDDPDRGFTLCFEDRDGQPGLHRYYDAEFEQQRRCRLLTLHLRLGPDDVEQLFRMQPLAPCVASVFIFRIGGERVRATLRTVEGYDPEAASTRCTFAILPAD